MSILLHKKNQKKTNLYLKYEPPLVKINKYSNLNHINKCQQRV